MVEVLINMKSAIPRICLFLSISWFCNGFPDLPFFYEAPSCSDRYDGDVVPYYEFDRPMQPFEKRSDSILMPSTAIPLMNPENWKEFVPKNQDIQYLTVVSSPQSGYKANLNRKKRSLEGETLLSEGVGKSEEFNMNFMPQNRNRENVKTIHLSSSFTPRLGRKRSDEELEDSNDSDEGSLGISSRSRVIDLTAGNAFTPRLGRSEGPNRIQLNAGSGFTPRLGRSEGPNRIQLNAGGAFTPRLGRAEGQGRIQLNAGSAFTPRLGRSQRINLNAGSAFTPRLGRSEGTNRITLNAGNAFTPRLGRSDGRRISLNAGGAFTPRLG